VEPAVAGQELVGVLTGAKEVDKALELLGVARADVGSLAKKVLRILDATDEGVDAGRTEAGVDDDGADQKAGRFSLIHFMFCLVTNKNNHKNIWQLFIN
jgi:hypothetical protein